MPYSSGTFSILNTFVPGTTILSSAMNQNLSDIATNGLSYAVLKNGTQTLTANLPMSGFKLTGLGAGSANGDSVRFEQVGTLSGNNTWTGTQAFQNTTSFTAVATFSETTANTFPLVLTSTDAGANPSPGLDLYRNSASPAASDFIGQVVWNGQNSTPAKFTYAKMYTQIISVTAASETGAVYIEPRVSGGAVQTLGVSSGVIIGGPTGTFKGAGTLNVATGYYTNNVQQAGTVNKQVFTGSGTYTPSTGMLYCIVECVGGGGGSGGCANGAAANVLGAGGGAGSYSRYFGTAATIGASKAVTIGAAGSAGTAGNNAGGAGGDTSLGTLCVGKGGSGGGGSTLATSSAGAGGTGGVAGTGDVTATGQSGGAGYTGISNPPGTGQGGSGQFGAGGKVATSVTTSTAAAAGTGFGGGGSGGWLYNGGANIAGATGSAGVVIITEFCS